MNIWSKMMTALRGGVNEAGEAIIDSQALRILDQEIHADSKQSTGIEFQQLIHGFASGTARFIRIMDCKNCMICVAVTMPVFWSGINYKRNKGLAEFFF